MTANCKLTVVEDSRVPQQKVDEPGAFGQFQIVFALVGKQGADVDPKVLLVGER